MDRLLRIVLLVLLATYLLMLGCSGDNNSINDIEEGTTKNQNSDDQNERDSFQEIDALKADLMVELLPTAYNISVSPAANYLVYCVPGATIAYFLVDLSTGNSERLDLSDEIPEAQLGNVEFSSDGAKMVYYVYSSEEQKGFINFSTVDIQPEVYHTISLPEEDSLRDPFPVWSVNHSSVYLITSDGLVKYILADGGVKEKIYSSFQFLELVGESEFKSSLTYSIKQREEKMAYYYDGKLNIVMLSNGDEVKSEKISFSFEKVISTLEFSPDGNHLFTLTDFELGKGHTLVVINAAGSSIGETEDIMQNIESASWGPDGHLAALTTEQGNRNHLVVFDSEFQQIYRAQALDHSREVLWVGDQLALLTGGSEKYSLYTVKYK